MTIYNQIRSALEVWKKDLLGSRNVVFLSADFAFGSSIVGEMKRFFLEPTLNQTENIRVISVNQDSSTDEEITAFFKKHTSQAKPDEHDRYIILKDQLSTFFGRFAHLYTNLMELVLFHPKHYKLAIVDSEKNGTSFFYHTQDLFKFNIYTSDESQPSDIKKSNLRTWIVINSWASNLDV